MTSRPRDVSVTYMKRDMELIRKLMMEQENEGPAFRVYEDAAEMYQIALMRDAGLIVGEVTDHYGAINRLTWSGHEFLDSMRDPTIWQSAKEKVLKPGASWTFGILVEFAKQEAMRRLGMLVQ